MGDRCCGHYIGVSRKGAFNGQRSGSRLLVGYSRRRYRRGLVAIAARYRFVGNVQGRRVRVGYIGDPRRRIIRGPAWRRLFRSSG